jgi:HAD superfamily hydrolase (TIGR01509 family)
MDPEDINAAVVDRLVAGYRRGLPLLPGAVEAVRALGARWPLGLASSSNVPVIALVLEETGLDGVIRAWVSSEQVARGKPAPDVYLEAARRLGVDAAACVAVEDSSNGLRAAAAAGMAAIAVPNPHYPPAEDALALASVSVPVVGDITPALVEEAFSGTASGR